MVMGSWRIVADGGREVLVHAEVEAAVGEARAAHLLFGTDQVVVAVGVGVQADAVEVAAFSEPPMAARVSRR